MLTKFLIVVPPAIMAVVLYAQESIQAPGTKMDPTLFAAAIVTVIAALGGVTVQVINSISAARDRHDAAAERRVLLERTNVAVTKTDALIGTADEIHAMTNSTNSNLQKALELMTEKNVGLERLMAQMEKEKKEIAATRALTDLQTSSALHTPVPVSEPAHADSNLKKIEVNTKDTANNTAKTDATVQELKDK